MVLRVLYQRCQGDHRPIHYLGIRPGTGAIDLNTAGLSAVKR